MRAAQLRDRVTVVTRPRTDDGEGGGVLAVTTAVPERVPADVRSLTSRERLLAASTEVVVTHIVTLRAHPVIGPQTQLRWGARTLQVVGPPIEHDHGRWFECHCVERL